MKTAIVNTSTANIASVMYALDRVKADYVLAQTPKDAQSADRLILPGVGAAAPAMKYLQNSGWSEALKAEERPVLGICLGMQLLFDWSEESNCALLGLIPGKVTRLPNESSDPWPHMGWNKLKRVSDDNELMQGICEPAFVYFVHGYYVEEKACTLALAQYGVCLSAIVQRNNIYGCQFHPERSSKTGAQILNNFLLIKQ